MSEEPRPDQVWELIVDGHRNRVETSGSVSRRVRWYVDDELVAQTKSMDEKVRLSVDGRPELGAVGVRFTRTGRPRRATHFEHDPSSELDASARALAGVGGLDLIPRPGSVAAEHEARVRAHPQRYAFLQTMVGVARVVVPMIGVAVLARFAFALPLPDWNLPRIPWPDLPTLPRPHLPTIPLPDWSLPEWSLPAWLRWLLEHAKFVWPVVLAFVLARAEVNRRKKQDELRAQRMAESRDQD